jgi:hypothetical protein
VGYRASADHPRACNRASCRLKRPNFRNSVPLGRVLPRTRIYRPLWPGNRPSNGSTRAKTQPRGGGSTKTDAWGAARQPWPRRMFRFRRKSGHGRSCHWLDPVANDPTRSPSVHRSSGKNHYRAAPVLTPSMRPLSSRSGLAISWILTVILFLENCLTSFLLPQLASSPFRIDFVKFVPT